MVLLMILWTYAFRLYELGYAVLEHWRVQIHVRNKGNSAFSLSLRVQKILKIRR